MFTMYSESRIGSRRARASQEWFCVGASEYRSRNVSCSVERGESGVEEEGCSKLGFSRRGEYLGVREDMVAALCMAQVE